MKTVNQIQQKIETNRSFLKTQGSSIPLRLKNRILRFNEQLEEIKKYLETQPNEKYVVSEKMRLQRIIDSKTEQYEHWLNYCCPDEIPLKTRRSYFNKETGLTTLGRQLKNITLILNN